MRAGASPSNHTLSTEAASVLKHALTLARRRGHAQVTPLHVAATLLTSRASPLRRACLNSHPHQPSHPLHSRALELCFNVALNRLPAAPGPHPSLSNALIAALKRAQAHQRRGCIEQQQQLQQQQQTLISIKVDLDQLILSILDDPSVSRVMREAGFSSTSVKNNLEDSTLISSVFQCYNPGGGAGGIYSTPNSPPGGPNVLQHFLQYVAPIPKKEDMNVLLQTLLGKSKRRNAVIIGDSVSSSASLVSELMRKVEHGEVPDELKSTQLVRFQLSSVLPFMKKDEVEMNVDDLKRKVESLSALSGRVMVYVGDIKWAVEDKDLREDNYNPVEHLITEIGNMISLYNNGCMKLWLISTANYETYIKCQMKQPPLDLQWSLQPVSLPSAALGLSLTRGNSVNVEEDEGVSCCQECIWNYEKEASAGLPYSYTHVPPQKEDLDELKRKYNKLCQNLHQKPHNASNLERPNKETISFLHPFLKQNHSPSSLPRFRRQKSCNIDFTFNNNQPNLDCLKDKEERITLALGNSAYTKRSTTLEEDLYGVFKENVPWQWEKFPIIIEALKGDKVILMEGNDGVGKRRLACAIAECMFGSSDFVTCVDMRSIGVENGGVLERVLGDGERGVVFVENVDFGDGVLVKFVCGEVGISRNVVVVLSRGESRVARDDLVIGMRLLVRADSNSDHDRKRKNKMEEVCSSFARRKITSSSVLDLNIKLNDDEDEESSTEVMRRIKNRVVLNLSLEQEKEAKEMFLLKMRMAFGGRKSVNFEVDEAVLEEVVHGARLYMNGLFEEWVKEVLEGSLGGVNSEEKEKSSFRLSLEGKGDSGGFKGTCLPKKIPLSFIC